MHSLPLAAERQDHPLTPNPSPLSTGERGVTSSPRGNPKLKSGSTSIFSQACVWSVSGGMGRCTPEPQSTRAGLPRLPPPVRPAPFLAIPFSFLPCSFSSFPLPVNSSTDQRVQFLNEDGVFLYQKGDYIRAPGEL